LEAITGFSSQEMKIELYSPQNQLLGVLDDNSKFLGFYPVTDYCRLNVINTDPYRIKNEFSDVSQVEKYEMAEQDYDKRQGFF
jgi:tubulin-folding cofactor B